MHVRVIGIGCGDPEQLTLEAVSALNSTDVFIAPEKRAGDPLLHVRERICRRHIDGAYRFVTVTDPERDRGNRVADTSGYRQAVQTWHDARATAYSRTLASLESTSTVGFLVWGDPAFYDSTIRILERVREIGDVSFSYDVLPGISALQLLAARHRLVLNDIGAPVTVTTGRQLRQAVDDGADNLVVVLNRSLDALELEGDWNIWWAGNLGTEGETLRSGTIADIGAEIATMRERLRTDYGWVMDTYLLRRARETASIADSNSDETNISGSG